MQLTGYLVADDGSVKMQYKQAAPVKYKSGKGEFAGHWVTFQFDATFSTQLPMQWISYFCQTGYPFGEYTYVDIGSKNYEFDANPYCRFH